MKHILIFTLLSCCIFWTCQTEAPPSEEVSAKPLTAADILGNPAYPAISYGGYRQANRDQQPTVAELKEDMQILAAMGIKLLRTYNVQLPQAGNILKAISELKEADPSFEMYVMLGAWIDCKNAWEPDVEPDHDAESEQNAGEIDRAVALAKQYPSIVKIIAVGNEAMVKWAASYYVQPGVILKWVNHLQALKQAGELPAELWITSSDNFASWGGGTSDYHVSDLNKLIGAVDFISMHTYPMHDTHYHPEFWHPTAAETDNTDDEKIKAAMERAKQHAQAQYAAVQHYVDSLGMDKPIHIGETGWASVSNEFYGPGGSEACDEYKQGLYYRDMRAWTDADSISCFFFEAFDERWKDAANAKGSENHFGLISLDGKVKYAIWDLVDNGTFEGLTRDGQNIRKSFDGDFDQLLSTVGTPPPPKSE